MYSRHILEIIHSVPLDLGKWEAHDDTLHMHIKTSTYTRNVIEVSLITIPNVNDFMDPDCKVYLCFSLIVIRYAELGNFCCSTIWSWSG